MRRRRGLFGCPRDGGGGPAVGHALAEVARGPADRFGTFGDEGPGQRRDVGNPAGQELGEVEPVRQQVSKNAGARSIPLEAPRQRARRVLGVVRQQPAPHIVMRPSAPLRISVRACCTAGA
jgi:hypothetical protein